MFGRAARCILSITLCGGAVAAERDVLPLKHGAYVNSGVTCSQASNATLTWYDGRYFYAGRDFSKSDWNRCEVKIDSHVGKTYVLSRSCTKLQPDETAIVTRSYTLSSATEFVQKTDLGTSRYRYCAQSALPRIWRGPSPY